MPAKTCKEILRECQKGEVEEEIAEGEYKKFPISITSSVINNSLMTTEGFYKFFQLSISICHPEMMDDSNLEEVIGKESGDFLTDLFKPLLILQGFITEKEEEPEKNEQANPNPNTMNI